MGIFGIGIGLTLQFINKSNGSLGHNFIKKTPFIHILSQTNKNYITATECDDGTYGYDCLNNCSGHCLNDTHCNKQTGHCDGGCKPGYTNDDCNKGE